ncbi:MAG: SDR family oxidoreductase, partial [Gemmatimonadaceae bacterium]
TDLEYVGAHELFVAALAASGVPYTVVRPTGFYYVSGDVLRLAARGRGVLVGNGRVRTNPVDERDVAAMCASAISLDEHDIPLGGPEIYTRREIVELAFEMLGRQPRVSRVPSAVVSLLAAPLRPINRRLHALMTFGAAMGRADTVAPAFGTRTLRAYFAELVQSERAIGQLADQPVFLARESRPPMLPSGR